MTRGALCNSCNPAATLRMPAKCAVPQRCCSHLHLQMHIAQLAAPAAKWPMAHALGAAQKFSGSLVARRIESRWYHMDTQIVWGCVILLLPLIVAVALVPACWLRDRLIPRARKPQWLELRWLAQPHRHVLECSHPVLLEVLTGCVNRGDPCTSN